MRRPGDCLIGVWPAVAASALAFNIFYLRRYHAGLISGKLSDLAINVLLPIVLVAAAEWALFLWSVLRRATVRPICWRGHVAACAASGAYFTLLKVWPPFTQVHCALLGILELPFRFGGAGHKFRNITDVTDLVTLVANPLAAVWLQRRSQAEPLTHLPDIHQPHQPS